MLSDEEEAIEWLKRLVKINKRDNLDDTFAEILLNLIEKQSKEIEHQIEKRANQKKELAILNAKQIEFNKLVNTVNSYKGQFKRQQKEIEELKEKNRQGKMRIVQLENEITARIEDVNKYFTPNDKIKAKIKELEKYRDKFDECYMLKDVRIKQNQIQVLQSLLEKE